MADDSHCLAVILSSHPACRIQDSRYVSGFRHGNRARCSTHQPDVSPLWSPSRHCPRCDLLLIAKTTIVGYRISITPRCLDDPPVPSFAQVCIEQLFDMKKPAAIWC